MITVKTQYYAALRDEAGCSDESISTSAASADELYRELKQKHDFSYATEDLKVAINDSFSKMSSPLAEGDTIVFIPPVAGG